MKNKKIVVLLRAPFLDRIPSLKTLIVYLSNQGYNITIISSYSREFPVLDFQSDNIKLLLVVQRYQKYGIPTLVKLLAQCIKTYIRHKPSFFIGGDYPSNRLLYRLSKIFPIKYINFLLEYPDIHNQEERAPLQGAQYIITHDRWHGNFLKEHYGINDGKLLFLPNSSYTPQYYKKTNFLHSVLKIPAQKKIILHSGGLGIWFLCQELALSTNLWPKDYVLVFHTSHIVEKSPYYQEMINKTQNNDKVYYSTTPVSNEVLDDLVSSSYIGIALYSIEVLGYRALNMGLAAGKIGNYLKCGIPVIATNLPSLKYIEEYKCGVLVDEISQIEEAMNEISTNYDLFSNNAHKCYQELWEPERYLSIIQKTLFGE